MDESGALIDQSNQLKIQPIVWKNGDEKTELPTAGSTDPEKGEPPINGSALRQVLAAFVAQLGTVNTGMAFGFSAIAIPQLKAANSSIPIDEDQSSWVGKYN